ncbi:MAG TPA: O-antigen ligase family protein [Capsulimonadaceae bacterium]|jgi:O-antigen ligase
MTTPTTTRTKSATTGVSTLTVQTIAWSLLLLVFVVGSYAKLDGFMPLTGQPSPVLAVWIGDALVFVALLAATLRQSKLKAVWRAEPFDYALAAWCIISVVWLVIGLQRQVAHPNPYAYALYGGGPLGPFQFFINQAAAFAAYYLARGFGQRKPSLEAPALAIEIVAAAVGLLCALEACVTQRPIRLEASFTNPNLLSSFLVLTIPLIAARALSREGGRTATGVRVALIAGLILALVFTKSRGGEIGLLIAFAVIGLAMLRRTAQWIRYGRGLAAIAAILVVATIMAALVFKHSLGSAQSHLAGDMGRVSTWKASYKLFTKQPVFGTGLGGYPGALRDLGLSQPLEVSPGKLINIPLVHVHAHDLFLNVAAERGSVGLCLLIVSLVLVGKRWLAVVTRPGFSPVQLGAAGALAGWFIQNFADFTLWYPAIAMVVFVEIGLIMSPNGTPGEVNEAEKSSVKQAS